MGLFQSATYQDFQMIFHMNLKSKSSQKILQELYQFPANTQKAYIHKESHKFTNLQSSQKLSKYPKEDFQLYNDQFDQHQQTSNFQQLCSNNQINSTAQAYFLFIRMNIFYLLLVFLISGIYQIVSSIDGNYCLSKDTKCSDSFLLKFSTYHKKDDLSKTGSIHIQNGLTLLTVIISLIYFQVYKKYYYKLYGQMDSQLYNQGDYSIFVEMINQQSSYNNNGSHQYEQIQFRNDYSQFKQQIKSIFEKEIIDWLRIIRNLLKQDYHTLKISQNIIVSKNIQTNNEQQNMVININPAIEKITYDLILTLASGFPVYRYNQYNNKEQKLKQHILNKLDYLINQAKIVTSISYGYDLQEFQNIYKQRLTLINSYIRKKNKNSNDLNEMKQKIKQINEKQIDLCEKYASETYYQHFNQFIGKIIISFQLQHYRQYLIQLGKHKQYQIRNKLIQIDQQILSYPTEIIWQNMKYSLWQIIKRIIKISFIVILIILISLIVLFIIIQALKQQQKHSALTNKNQTQIQSTVIHYSYVNLISIFTFIINKIILWTFNTKCQQPGHSQLSTKYALKITLITLSQIFYISSTQFIVQQYPKLSDNGLIQLISSQIYTNAFLMIFFDYIRVNYLINLFRLWKKYGFSIMKQYLFYDLFNYKKKTQVLIFQKQLNKDFQYSEFDVIQQYSQYLLLLYISMSYFYLVPYGVLITALAFIAKYWIDKRDMILNSSKIKQIGINYSLFIMMMFQFSLCNYIFGNIQYIGDIYNIELSSKLFFKDIHIFKDNLIKMGSSLLAFLIFSVYFILNVMEDKYGSEVLKCKGSKSKSYSYCIKNNLFDKTYWGLNPATYLIEEPNIFQEKYYENKNWKQINKTEQK